METSVLMQVSREFYSFSGADGLAIVTLAILESILLVDNSLIITRQKQNHTFMIAF